VNAAALRITQTMTDAHTLARKLWGDSFSEKVAPWKELINVVQAKVRADSPLQAYAMMLRSGEALAEGDQLALCAAVVEMLSERAA
jgi:hypothetical protein